jgi:pimeloyl-ACP methyl ester carboxylesterase
VPYETSFDHDKIADGLQLKMRGCLKALGPDVRQLPMYGIGHSLGSVLTLMMNSRYGVRWDGTVLLSFNHRPVTDTIPFLSPLLAPGTRALGPILTAVRAQRAYCACVCRTTMCLSSLTALIHHALPSC